MMYCPKCGQEISSNDLRFCPRCGLQLFGLTQFISDGRGLRTVDTRSGLGVFKRKEYRLGAQMIFFSIFAIPLALIFSIVFDSPGPLIVPVILFLAGLARLSYSFLFGKGSSVRDDQVLLDYAQPAALNEGRQYVSPIEGFPRSTTTKELVTPPSVTENTTNLLHDKS